MLNAGLLVSKRAREIVGDEVLKTVFEEAKLSYVAEIGDFIFEDLKQNDVKSLLVINDGDRETWMEDIDQRLGISPLAVITIPYTWFEGKSGDFTLALLMGYSLKAELMDLVYRVQPTRSSSISRRSLIKLKVYEYKPYPVLYDEVHAEREINRAVEACPLNLVVKTPEGPSVGSPEKCTACGYCSASSFLGYFEVPTATTDQVVAFINAVVKYYSKPASLLFTDGMPSKIVEGVFPFVMPCVASVHESFILASYASGLTPIVHV